jgi:hypothetical protein
MSTRFEFRETRSVITALEVHEAEAPPPAERLYHVLLAMRIQLVALAESISDGKSVVRLSVCELDGAPIKPPRRRALVQEIAPLFTRAAAPDPEPSSAPARTPRRAA